jgi:hypothetical protein
MELLRFYLGYEAHVHLEMHVRRSLMPPPALNSQEVSLGFTTQFRSPESELGTRPTKASPGCNWDPGAVTCHRFGNKIEAVAPMRDSNKYEQEDKDDEAADPWKHHGLVRHPFSRLPRGADREVSTPI